LKKVCVIFFAIMTAFIFVLISCDSREKLYIYNWTYYTPDSIIEKFENEFNVRIIYDEFASNEEMFAKLTAVRKGKGGYDVVFPSKDYVPIMIHEGMLERIDKTKIKNLENIDPALLARMTYDQNMDYSVPYFYGAAGIAVNTGKVTRFERNWSIFSREDLAQRMTMLDDFREVFGAAFSSLGYSVNTTNGREITQARDYIILNWKPNLLRFDSETIGKGYANGDFWVVHTFPEMVYEEITDNPQLLADTVFFIPAGSPSYIDNMVILKNARNVERAHEFINFIHRPEIYAEFVDAFGLPATVNVPARRISRTSVPMYLEEELDLTELVDYLGEYRELYTDAWFNSIRAGE